MKKKLLFKIVTGERGRPETYHEYKIYDDGSFEGFTDIIYARNNHIAIKHQKMAEIQLINEESPIRNINEA
jgi:hypothetical protein